MHPTLVQIVATVLKVDPARVGPDSNADTLEGWDSLAHWEIIAEVEAAFAMEFTMDEAVAFQRLGDIQDALLRRGAMELVG